MTEESSHCQSKTGLSSWFTLPIELLQLPAHCRHAAPIVHVHGFLSLLRLTEIVDDNPGKCDPLLVKQFKCAGPNDVMCNSKQQRTCKKPAFHSQGIEHHGSFKSIGSPRTWHLCHWNLKPFWQCFKEACWGLLPSPVCKFAQSMSVYIFMGNPTELQRAWRQAPCATFVVTIVDKRVVGMSSLTHEALLFHDTSVEQYIGLIATTTHIDH